MGSILLGIASDLQAFNFRETFTDPFEVSLHTVGTFTLSHGSDTGAVVQSVAWSAGGKQGGGAGHGQ